MILSCDPPRHAFLIHFGPRQQPRWLQERACDFNGRRVEIAVNPQQVPPTLVAIHFGRHQFRLPFIEGRGQHSKDSLHIQYGLHEKQCFFYFVPELRDYGEWRAYPGLTVLLSPPGQAIDGASHSTKDRPVLQGLRVDTDVLGVDIDESEFVYQFGADYLKDVSVLLFTRFMDD